MEKIQVERIDESTYRVTVNAARTTTHTVKLAPEYYQKLTGGGVTHEELLLKSFEFLMERESNNSILRSFELPVIGTYFPEYEKEIRSRFNL